ncbi:MAG TPA: hypothetical protein PKY81_08270 [bacterium]|nr:hypothetical protein [bacterium]
MVKFNRIQIQTPVGKIFSRLGYNKHLTEIDEKTRLNIFDKINDAKDICAPSACFYRTGIKTVFQDTVIIESGCEIKSVKIAELLKQSSEIIFFAGFVGKKIIEKINEVLKIEKGSVAVVYDAAASEIADSIMDWLETYFKSELKREGLKITDRRFSPGYGDFKIEYQKFFFDILQLSDSGIELTPEYMLVPEKTVTALCGIF